MPILYLLSISGRPDRFFKGTRVKQEVLVKPVRSLPQVIEMLPYFSISIYPYSRPIIFNTPRAQTEDGGSFAIKYADQT